MDLFTDDLKFNKIIFRDKFYFPDQINHEIQQLVNYIKSNTISDTPFIYLFAQNHIKTIIAYFAIIKSGHVCVLVEPDIGKIELEEMKCDTPPCAMIHLVASDELFNYNQEIIFTSNNPEYDSFDQDQLTDVCTMVYTAADDGFAKAAMLTKKNLITNAFAGQESDGINDKSVFSALLPFHHMFGLQTGILTPLLAGSSILIEDISDLSKLYVFTKDMIKHKVSNIYSIPVIYYILSRSPEIKSAISTVSKICSGGYKLHTSIYEVFLKKAGKEIAEGYGITEASPVCAWHRSGENIKIESVGRAYCSCEVKILDDKNNEYPIGQNGEICVRGENVIKGYYKNNNANQKVLRNGWFHTGDIGKIDLDGYIYITGLLKRMLNVAGRKVYPTEVERLLKKHENVNKVEVYGEPNSLLNNTVKARIELIKKGNESEKALKEWCIDNISNYKIPKTIEFT